MVRNQTELRICKALAAKIRSFDATRPILMSPGYDGAKHHPENPIPAFLHHKSLKETVVFLEGLINIIAPMDGHVNFNELEEYMSGTAEILHANKIQHWSNLETFDRDMPWRFPPIKWEKMLWKLEQAESAGMTDALTFEFSHFMSPHSMYPTAGHLYDRYCEYAGLPARARDFR